MNYLRPAIIGLLALAVLLALSAQGQWVSGLVAGHLGRWPSCILMGRHET